MGRVVVGMLVIAGADLRHGCLAVGLLGGAGLQAAVRAGLDPGAPLDERPHVGGRDSDLADPPEQRRSVRSAPAVDGRRRSPRTPVPRDQLDDVLKSLVVFDERGAVAKVSLPGEAPLSEALRGRSQKESGTT